MKYPRVVPLLLDFGFAKGEAVKLGMLKARIWQLDDEDPDSNAISVEGAFGRMTITPDGRWLVGQTETSSSYGTWISIALCGGCNRLAGAN